MIDYTKPIEFVTALGAKVLPARVVGIATLDKTYIVLGDVGDGTSYYGTFNSRGTFVDDHGISHANHGLYAHVRNVKENGL